MRYHLRLLLWATAVLFALVLPGGVLAQNPDPFGFKFNAGQGIQPIFEGWAKNADGTFSMYFGYINRNYVETMEIPVGPANKIEPGMPDRGQPTFFNTRIRRNQFNVVVPKDWGKKELVWSLTVRGKTEQAIAWLEPEWEIDPIYGGKTRSAESLKNTAPVLTVDVPSTVTLPKTLALTSQVKDDGLPVPKANPPKQAIGQETPPTLKPLPDQPEVPVNVPQVGSGRGGRGNGPKGLLVTWIVWRGPAAVTFDPSPAVVADGKAVVTATFTKPGVYILRGEANDGELKDQKDVTVTVNGTSQ